MTFSWPNGPDTAPYRQQRLQRSQTLTYSSAPRGTPHHGCACMDVASQELEAHSLATHHRVHSPGYGNLKSNLCAKQHTETPPRSLRTPRCRSVRRYAARRAEGRANAPSRDRSVPQRAAPRDGARKGAAASLQSPRPETSRPRHPGALKLYSAPRSCQTPSAGGKTRSAAPSPHRWHELRPPAASPAGAGARWGSRRRLCSRRAAAPPSPTAEPTGAAQRGRGGPGRAAPPGGAGPGTRRWRGARRGPGAADDGLPRRREGRERSRRAVTGRERRGRPHGRAPPPPPRGPAERERPVPPRGPTCCSGPRERSAAEGGARRPGARRRQRRQRRRRRRRRLLRSAPGGAVATASAPCCREAAGTARRTEGCDWPGRRHRGLFHWLIILVLETCTFDWWRWGSFLLLIGRTLSGLPPLSALGCRHGAARPRAFACPGLRGHSRAAGEARQLPLPGIRALGGTTPGPLSLPSVLPDAAWRKKATRGAAREPSRPVTPSFRSGARETSLCVTAREPPFVLRARRRAWVPRMRCEPSGQGGYRVQVRAGGRWAARQGGVPAYWLSPFAGTGMVRGRLRCSSGMSAKSRTRSTFYPFVPEPDKTFLRNLFCRVTWAGGGRGGGAARAALRRSALPGIGTVASAGTAGGAVPQPGGRGGGRTLNR